VSNGKDFLSRDWRAQEFVRGSDKGKMGYLPIGATWSSEKTGRSFKEKVRKKKNSRRNEKRQVMQYAESRC